MASEEISRSPYFAGSLEKDGSSAFLVGQLVWVQISPKREETGTVVRVGCTMSRCVVIANDDNEEEEEEDDEMMTTRHDGIMVALTVSQSKGIFAPHQLRPFQRDDESDAKTRASKRTKTTTAAASAAATTATRSKTTPRDCTMYTSRLPLRSVITPSPQQQEDDAEDLEESIVEKKPAAKRKRTEVSTSSAAKKTKPRKRGPAKQKKDESSDSEVSGGEEDETNENPDDEDDENNIIRPSSDEEEEDRPFQIEYAPSSRSTCRRCDEVIARGSVRVSHVPLFRGKPGFRVYRHLECAIFSEEIKVAQDVGGWSRLKAPDQEALALRVEESKLELEQENKEIQPDELVPVVFQGEMRTEPPPGLCANLLPFQVEGTSWMYHQEVHVPDVRGGILADEMGMGKTIQTITTMLDNRPKLQHCAPGSKHPPGATDLDVRMREEALWKTATKDWKHEMEMINVPKKIHPKKYATARAGTLVICPVIALSQWKAEIEKFTEPGTLTIGTYHGPDRTKEMPMEMMRKYDVVLTTYQVLEHDFRKMVSPNKVSCPNCGAKFKIDKLRIHLKYFCGESAQRTEAQARQRRTADRPGRNQNNPRSGKGKGNKKKKMPPMTKEFAKRAASRKKVRVSAREGYDSDSELSVCSDVNDFAATKRPSRSAAKSASKRVAATVKEERKNALASRKRGYESDSDSTFASSSEDCLGSDGDSDESNVPVRKGGKKKPSPKKISGRRRSTDVDDEQNSAAAKAIVMQRKALENARKSKKKPIASKKGKKKGTTKGRKKKFDDESSSDDESDDDPSDPMAGIDLDALMEEAMAGSRFSPLHAFSWWRVVLDEAHFIKSRSSQTAAAAFSLISIHRWCLSGTPLQNRVGELYSLIRFLRIDPMAHYFCRMKGCSCKSIHYRMQHGKCQDCGHRGFSHFAHFNKHVLNPIQRDGYTGDGRRAMFKLKDEVLDTCLLRRTKETRAEDMNLPPRIVTIRPVRLHPVEEDFYNALYTQTKSSFDDYVAQGTLLNNYAHIFDLLTKMRQAVDHPYLIIHSKRNSERNKRDNGHPAVANGSVDCDMCHEPPTDRVVSSCCGAGFCRSCVIEYLTGAVGDNTPCPSCESPFTIDLNQAASDAPADDGVLNVASAGTAKSSPEGIPSLKEMQHVATGSILRRINLADFATSTKIEVLVQELIQMRKQRPGSKALVFSQFVNMLDLVRWRLRSDPCLSELGLGVRILHGGMDVKSRDQALKDFREDNKCRVLLMSLKAAGVALNLTVASECYLLDLWWNPSAEMQAIDRTHRLGQYRPIRAVRFVAEGTVEERVLQLQEKKRLVFDGTIGRDAGSLKMLTVDDMVSLFA